MKKLLQLGSAFLLSLSSLLTLAAPLAHAAGPFTCTWTGGGADDNFSTALNWSGCNGAAPQPLDHDALVFPFDTAATFSPVNDLSGAIFSAITFSGATSGINTYFDITGTPFTFHGDIVNSATGTSPLAAIENDITLTNTSLGMTVLTTDPGAMVDLTGALTSSVGDVPISKTGTGTLYLDGDNTAYTGLISALAGKLVAGNANAIGTTSNQGALIGPGVDFVINTCVTQMSSFNGRLNLSGGSSVITGDFPVPKLFSNPAGCFSSPSTTNFGALSIPNGPTNNLDLNGNITLGSDITFAGTVGTTTLTGALSGAYTITMLPGYVGKLVVAGSSNTTSTPNGTYTSAQFTKILADSQPSETVSIFGNNIITINGQRGDTTVESGGILKGTGTVGALFVDADSFLAPGESPGCLNTGNLDLVGTFQAEIGGTTVCSGYDQTNVTGTVDITNATIDTILYNGFVPAVGQSYVVINNDGADAVTGTFTGLAENATFVKQGVTYRVSYVGGTGNDVVLTVTNINASQLPKNPNTGIGMITSNPLLSLGLTTLAAGTLVYLSRRLKPVTKR